MKLAPPSSGARPIRLLWFSARSIAPVAAGRWLLRAVAAVCLVVGLSFWLPGVWGVLWLMAAALAGAMLTRALFPDLPVTVAIAAAFLSGLVVCAAASFVLALVLSVAIERAVPVAGVLVTGVVAAVGWRRRAWTEITRLRPAPVELAVVLAGLLFGLWFYERALSYDVRAGEVTYAPGTYADIAVHVAEIRPMF